MTYKFTDQDVRDRRPGALPILDTDVEITVARNGSDLSVWINKAGIQVLRVRLRAAAAPIHQRQLLQFSAFSPDFVFTIGDTAEGLARLKQSLGLSDESSA